MMAQLFFALVIIGELIIVLSLLSLITLGNIIFLTILCNILSLRILVISIQRR